MWRRKPTHQKGMIAKVDNIRSWQMLNISWRSFASKVAIAKISKKCTKQTVVDGRAFTHVLPRTTETCNRVNLLRNSLSDAKYPTLIYSTIGINEPNPLSKA
jgi:hypothetical protein